MESYDINEGDFLGYTPLIWAARNGHEEMVKILLGRKEVNSNKPDNQGQTPLSHAASGGHYGVVKILLGVKRSTLTSQTTKAKRRSCVPLGVDTRGW